MATTFEKIDKIENIHDDGASFELAGISRDAEASSDYCKWHPVHSKMG